MADINRRNLIEKEVRIQRYAQVGAGATILPGVTIAEGACTGSMTLVNKDLEPWKIYVGVPCRILKDREPFSM